jgi:hypothetical protein
MDEWGWERLSRGRQIPRDGVAQQRVVSRMAISRSSLVARGVRAGAANRHADGAREAVDSGVAEA